MNYDINKIRCYLSLSNFVSKLHTAKIAIKYATALTTIVWEDFLGRTREKGSGQNIVIIGGGLHNKGAQAMTFTVVDQMRRKFPYKNIYLFSTEDFIRDDEEKKEYKFTILPWDFNIKFWLLGSKDKRFKEKSSYGYLGDTIETVIKGAFIFIDISGYALSSQWGLFASINYLLNISTAKKYSIPYYIFPQSIGPFDYNLLHKMLIFPLLRLYLKYPEKIYAREDDGARSVKKFTKNKVQKSCDIVLQNDGYNINNIFKSKSIYIKNVNIEPNSVGIIPNLRVIERAKNESEVYLIYETLINNLIKARKNVYILRHSYEDLAVCKKIKSFFPDNDDNVKLISDDLNALELEY